MKIVLDTVRWFGYERVFSTIGLGKMSDADDEASAGELLWQSARENYEDPAQGLAAIAARLGVSKYKLVTEARRRGWTLRGLGIGVGGYIGGRSLEKITGQVFGGMAVKTTPKRG